MKPAWCYALRVVALVAFAVLIAVDAAWAAAVSIPLGAVTIVVFVSDEVVERGRLTRSRR